MTRNCGPARLKTMSLIWLEITDRHVSKTSSNSLRTISDAFGTRLRTAARLEKPCRMVFGRVCKSDATPPRRRHLGTLSFSRGVEKARAVTLSLGSGKWKLRVSHLILISDNLMLWTMGEIAVDIRHTDEGSLYQSTQAANHSLNWLPDSD